MSLAKLPAPTIPMYPTRRDWDDLACEAGADVEAFVKRLGAYAKVIDENTHVSPTDRLWLLSIEERTRELLQDALGELQGCCWKAMEANEEESV